MTVSLPLLRDYTPKTTDSSNSAGTSSMISSAREADVAITMLRERVTGLKVSLSGFDNDSKDPISNLTSQMLKGSVSAFLSDWYGLEIVPFSSRPSIVVCNETDSTIITKLVQRLTLARSNASIVVLCSHNARFDRTLDVPGTKSKVGFVAKPIGPLKLAKAIVDCLNGIQPNATPGSSSQDSSDLNNLFEELLMSPQGGEVLDNTRIAASSDNARKALESPTPNAAVEKRVEFPFPTPEPNEQADHHTSLEPPTGAPTRAISVPAAVTEKIVATISLAAKKAVQEAKPKTKFPTLMVVDDNQINLSLLSTYLNRRKYETIHEAQNGLEAVHQFERRVEGYDIIFMDITMPILDGFGATRQIRTIEENRRKRVAASTDGKMEARAPALIIAFTGRSSIEDQTEAVRVGIDLFMTKPVAFKEVGKIIDNWLANKEKERRGSLGSVGDLPAPPP